jgi:hypothetical protein
MAKKKMSRYMKEKIEAVAYGYYFGHMDALMEERDPDRKMTDEETFMLNDEIVEAVDAARAEMMARGKAEL